MANMTLGGYTFEKNPTSIDGVITKDVPMAIVKTWESVKAFVWDPTYKGKEVPLNWTGMSATMYDQLQAIYEAQASVVFDPQDGEGKTFNVLVRKLTGTYYKNLASSTSHYRKNVTLRLVILSEV